MSDLHSQSRQQKEQAELRMIADAQRAKDTVQVQALLQRRSERFKRQEIDEAPFDPYNVPEMTRHRLYYKAETYFQQLLFWRPMIEVQRLDTVRLIEARPRFGYASIIRSLTPDSSGALYPWIFYVCNFPAKFGMDDQLFDSIPTSPGVTFFGLGLSVDTDGRIIGRNRSIRGNGLLFATSDPTEAFENVSRLCGVKKLWSALSRAPVRSQPRQQTIR
ncbi:MAG: hypothetical protein RIR97_879 [Pseudomonadota bacterium]